MITAVESGFVVAGVVVISSNLSRMCGCVFAMCRASKVMFGLWSYKEDYKLSLIVVN